MYSVCLELLYVRAILAILYSRTLYGTRLVRGPFFASHRNWVTEKVSFPASERTHSQALAIYPDGV